MQQISAGDAEISQALQELEEKLDGWFEAFSAVADAAPTAAPPEPEAESPKGLLVRDAEPETDVAAGEAPTDEQVVEEPPAADATPPDSEVGDEANDEAQRRREEDEELLSQLDPEIATAIRVKRRLGDNTRSVRELLDEYEQEQGAEKDEQRRKRWWR